jgi:hypothetical protein
MLVAKSRPLCEHLRNYWHLSKKNLVFAGHQAANSFFDVKKLCEGGLTVTTVNIFSFDG